MRLFNLAMATVFMYKLYKMWFVPIFLRALELLRCANER